MKPHDHREIRGDKIILDGKKKLKKLFAWSIIFKTI